MDLKAVLKELEHGGSKGIRRKKWDPGTWLKLNDYGCQDDLIYMAGDNRCTRGYCPNIMDFFADDWETIS